MNTPKVKYDFNHAILTKDRKYRRYAREHIALSSINSDVIDWEVVETETALNIPIKYNIHYRIKSIIGIEKDQSPIYDNHHILEIAFPPRYPLEPCKIKMQTPIWHPNIKSDGNYKGRICGNVKNFGRAYDLYQLVLRIGEILQYKNYHAEHVPPYPEDSKVAEWVMDYAEPNGIVSNVKRIYVDDTPLLRKETPTLATDQNKEEQTPAKEENTPSKEPGTSKTDIPKIRILGQREQKFKRSKLVIKIKNKDTSNDEDDS